MIFRIQGTLFRDDLGELPELLAVVRLGFRRRHRVYLDPPGYSLDGWLNSRPLAEAAWVRAAFDFSLRSQPATERVEVRVAEGTTRWSAEPPELCVADAHRLAHMPLRLLIEDFEDDAHFIRWVGHALEGAHWLRLNEALAHGWAEVEHGGGNTSMCRKVDALDLFQVRRTWVMFDHDGLTPGDSNRSNNSRLLRERCDARTVRRHPLMRRSIENYLPVVLLEHWAKDHFKSEDEASFTRPEVQERRQGAVDAFKRLLPAQRRHYYFREGLRKDAARGGSLPAPFANLPWEDQVALACGFDAHDGAGITRLFGDPRARVQPRVLREDGSYGEAAAILKSIVEAL